VGLGRAAYTKGRWTDGTFGLHKTIVVGLTAVGDGRPTSRRPISRCISRRSACFSAAICTSAREANVRPRREHAKRVCWRLHGAFARRLITRSGRRGWKHAEPLSRRLGASLRHAKHAFRTSKVLVARPHRCYAVFGSAGCMRYAAIRSTWGVSHAMPQRVEGEIGTLEKHRR